MVNQVNITCQISAYESMLATDVSIKLKIFLYSHRGEVLALVIVTFSLVSCEILIW